MTIFPTSWGLPTTLTAPTVIRTNQAMAKIRKSQEASHTEGSVAVEYGLVLPAMLLFTLGIMDAGRLL